MLSSGCDREVTRAGRALIAGNVFSLSLEAARRSASRRLAAKIKSPTFITLLLT